MPEVEQRMEQLPRNEAQHFIADSVLGFASSAPTFYEAAIVNLLF